MPDTLRPSRQGAASGQERLHGAEFTRPAGETTSGYPAAPGPRPAYLRSGAPGSGGGYGVTPDKFRPTTPASTSPIETIFSTETDSPRARMPTAAVPAAPMPVQTA